MKGDEEYQKHNRYAGFIKKRKKEANLCRSVEVHFIELPQKYYR